MSEELARRAVASPHWRWLPGMLVDSDHYGSWRLYESGPNLSACGVRGGFVAAWDAVADAERMDAYPALDDPATVGALLALVREAYDARVHVRARANKWRCYSGVTPVGEWADTEAAALVAALEAAP